MSDNERPSIRKMIEDKASQKGATNAAEKTMPKLFLICAIISILTTFGIVLTLLFETVTFFSEVSIVEFLTSSEWYPMFSDPDYGIRPLLLGTFTVAAIAMVVAIPVGLAVAIYLSEYASDKKRRTIKPILEVLAGIPTIVYGFFALTFVTPVLQSVIPGLAIYNALSPGLVMGIMIIPMVASLSEDAMSAVPQSMREGAFALGATRLEVSLKVVFPAALSGIIASFVLSISRAIGETMIVTVAGGGSPAQGFDITSSMQTMTAYIVQMSLGDAGFGTTVYYSIYAVGMTLFIFTLVMNILAQFISKRFREEY
ncbi:phosphate ABC transporter permease subunit PstC [Salibacterium qingdaonense]|uniref:Phosphate transport system permease protein n=1 Tax=Salibacterium qingdaonense TaxID=266892 RepID=A0A1I4MTX1_9BACI|nr:phosphate ABC transporter permease subunit PstC [Salibacterium qingdaonense]SFM06744.1 phosphate transport system permease protein [Salibacterium qingdaonense]